MRHLADHPIAYRSARYSDKEGEEGVFVYDVRDTPYAHALTLPARSTGATRSGKAPILAQRKYERFIPGPKWRFHGVTEWQQRQGHLTLVDIGPWKQSASSGSYSQVRCDCGSLLFVPTGAWLGVAERKLQDMCMDCARKNKKLLTRIKAVTKRSTESEKPPPPNRKWPT